MFLKSFGFLHIKLLKKDCKPFFVIFFYEYVSLFSILIIFDSTNWKIIKYILYNIINKFNIIFLNN